MPHNLFDTLQTFDLGFDADRLVTTAIVAPPSRSASRDAEVAYYLEAEERRYENVVPVAGDATDREFTTRVAAGADVVYFCLNATSYSRWVEEFPPLSVQVMVIV